MKIYLLRHGESEDDLEDCYGGAADFALTKKGEETASVIAQKLADSGIEMLYTSPYKRAAQTASTIAEKLGCEVNPLADLRERNSYGVLSGVNKARAAEIFSLVLAGLKGKPGDYYGGESVLGDEPLDEFDARVKAIFDFCVNDAAGRETIGIVTHGNVTRSLYRTVLGVKGKVGLDLLALTVISQSGQKTVIESQEGVTIE